MRGTCTPWDQARGVPRLDCSGAAVPSPPSAPPGVAALQEPSSTPIAVALCSPPTFFASRALQTVPTARIGVAAGGRPSRLADARPRSCTPVLTRPARDKSGTMGSGATRHGRRSERPASRVLTPALATWYAAACLPPWPGRCGLHRAPDASSLEAAGLRGIEQLGPRLEAAAARWRNQSCSAVEPWGSPPRITVGARFHPVSVETSASNQWSARTEVPSPPLSGCCSCHRAA